MTFTNEQIIRLTKLAKLPTPTQEEIDHYINSLSPVIDYFKILDEVDTVNEETTLQISGMTSVLYEDAERESDKEELSASLLRCSELPKKAKQLRIKRVL